MKYWTEEQIERIISAIAENRFAVFFGSGISASSGLPDWDGLITNLMESIKISRIHKSSSHMGLLPLKEKNSLGMLNYLNDLDPEAFENQFRKIFSKERNKYNATEEGKLIAQLETLRFITINYDFCFQQSFQKVHPSTAFIEHVGGIDKKAFDNIRYPTIIQIHGTAENRTSEIILTSSQYDIAYRDGNILPEFLEHLFKEYLVLFVGFGFADADIDRILSRSNIYSQTPGKYKHIGIFGYKGNKDNQDILHDFARREQNTEAVFYKISGSTKKQSHQKIKDLLNELQSNIAFKRNERKLSTSFEADTDSMASPPMIRDIIR